MEADIKKDLQKVGPEVMGWFQLGYLRTETSGEHGN
jgi:hypothetical protein